MVVTVDVDASRAEEAERALHEVTIPTVKEREGFVRGIWLRTGDKSDGRGIVVYDTEENARAAMASFEQEGPPPGAPVTVRSVEVFEVVGEA